VVATQKNQKHGVETIPKGETFAEYAARWNDDRDKRGFGHIQHNRWVLAKHIAPHIGEKPIVDVSKDDLEKIVQHFDNQIARGEYAWTTAKKWWQLVAKIFKDSCTSKNLSLRVRKDNPAADVAPPDTGDERAKAFLYPDEFLRFAACEQIDLKLRRIVALALYLYCRASEIVLLRWDDVDLEHGTATICRSWDRERKREKSTKTKVPRIFRIEPHIMPLLRVLYAARDNSGRVIPATFNGLARRLRRGLVKAGITRADLFLTDEKHIPLRFHDTRSSAVTWMAMRGDSVAIIMQRVGHAAYATTQIYLRQAEALRGTVGEPFPPLPACLLGTNAGEDTMTNLSTNLSERLDQPTEVLWISNKSETHSALERGGNEGPIESNTAEKSPMTDRAIIPSTMRNPAIARSSTDSRQIPHDDLDVMFRAIRDARERGDVDAAKRAWIDLGALLGIDVLDAPKSSVKRPRKRSA
jgi:integrase